jgi:hypothetical protein
MRTPLAYLTLALLVLNATPARAALDPQRNSPYQLQVVLQLASHRSLTPLFQEQLQRELANHLRLALGALARVEVVRTHPLLGEIEARGLEQALDAWEQVSDRQVHFLLLSYTAGTYQLEARRHDGMTGQAAPLVRRATTSDRTAVAEIAAQLVERDFALIGTVTNVSPSGNEVQLTLKGGGLGTPLERWLKAGDVFAVSRVSEQGGRLRSARIPWAVLQAIDVPRDGVCRCRFWRRYVQDDLREMPGVTYRAVQMATIKGPLRVRLLDDVTYRPLDGIQLRVTRPGAKKAEELTTTRAGLARTQEEYNHLALVQAVAGDQALALLPVPILDERPVVCRIKVKPEAEALAPLEFRRDAWLRRIYDNIRLSAQRVEELNAQLGQSLDGALKKGQDGLKSMDDELGHLTTEGEELRRQARERTPPAQLDLREGDQRLNELRQRQKELQQFVGRVEQVLKEAGSAKTQRLHKLLERARLLEGEADFEQALTLYKAVLKEGGEQVKVRERLEQLAKEWQLKGEQHAEARRFIYQTWPMLDVAGLKDNLEKARQALAVCREAQDRLTPLKLQRSNAVHAANLKKQEDALQRQEGEDAQNQRRVLIQVAQGLQRLHGETAAWLTPQPK